MVSMADKCGAICLVGDDHGDNDATFHCQVEAGHTGQHVEVFREGTCTLTWDDDERHLVYRVEDRTVHRDCGGEVAQNERYDACYCTKCLAWTERPCEAPDCAYCANRPLLAPKEEPCEPTTGPTTP